MKQSSEDNSHGLTPPPAPEDAGALAASEAHAVPAPPAPQQAPAQVAPADQFAGVPTPPAPRRVHHQRYRVLELPATQNHQEPRAFPQRRSRRQTLVARHLQHRRQKSRPAPHRRWQTPQQTNRTHPPHPRTHHHQLETSPRPTHHRLPRPNHPLPLTPIHRKIDKLIFCRSIPNPAPTNMRPTPGRSIAWALRVGDSAADILRHDLASGESV